MAHSSTRRSRAYLLLLTHLHWSLSTSSSFLRLLFKAVNAVPVALRGLFQANACKMCHLSAAITTQEAAGFLANMTPVLMFILLALFLRLVDIFLVVAIFVFLFRRYLTSSIPSSGCATLRLLLLLSLRRATSLLFHNFFMRRFFLWCWFRLYLIVIALEILFVVRLCATRVCW